MFQLIIAKNCPVKEKLPDLCHPHILTHLPYSEASDIFRDFSELKNTILMYNHVL